MDKGSTIVTKGSTIVTKGSTIVTKGSLMDNSNFWKTWENIKSKLND